jgi:hypothetical protein
MTMKNTGSRWEITVDGKPRTYDHSKQLAIEAAQCLKRKNPQADVTVRAILKASRQPSSFRRSNRASLRAPAKTRRPVSAYTIEISRTAGVRDQLEIRLSKREQHASHHAQDGNHDV